ncbi:hypothetical protein H8356DRAFT_1337580 [Neocallimastix lanati (nom. inval.)]|nr:hypothetical protein H8356DRAFT_1337580 [Neocallimastix sp. JGI-2020a]
MDNTTPIEIILPKNNCILQRKLIYKNLFNENSNLGINIYQGNNNFDELSDLLSKRIFFTISIEIFNPISLIFYFTPNTIRCNTKCL